MLCLASMRLFPDSNAERKSSEIIFVCSDNIKSVNITKSAKMRVFLSVLVVALEILLRLFDKLQA